MSIGSLPSKYEGLSKAEGTFYIKLYGTYVKNRISWTEMEIVPYYRRQIITKLAPMCLHDAEQLATSYLQYLDVIMSLLLSLMVFG